MTSVRDTSPGHSSTGSQALRFFQRVAREINVPRELYRAWLWRGPAALMNRKGKAKLMLAPHALLVAGRPLSAQLVVPLHIKKGTSRSGRIYYENVTARLYRHRIPWVFYPEPSLEFHLERVPENDRLDSSAQFEIELEFVPGSEVTELSQLPDQAFRVLVSGLEMELDGADRRELSPKFVWGSVEWQNVTEPGGRSQ